jgi:hypothetical protein
VETALQELKVAPSQPHTPTRAVCGALIALRAEVGCSVCLSVCLSAVCGALIALRAEAGCSVCLSVCLSV